MQFIGLFSLGIVAGILSGMFGVGGGIVIVPALVVFFGMTQQSAGGTSLVALLLPVGLLGVIEYYHSGKISMEKILIGLIIAAGLFSELISERKLQRICQMIHSGKPLPFSWELFQFICGLSEYFYLT